MEIMTSTKIDDPMDVAEDDQPPKRNISAGKVRGQMALGSSEKAGHLSPVQPKGIKNKTKRLSRNMCEKIRRDRLKSHIHQLASKLPIIATCGKKLDKCSILRLTVAFLKMHTGLKKMKLEPEGWCPSFLSRNNLGKSLHQTMDGFFLVVSQSGAIVYASDKITSILGHSQFNLLGKSINDLLHEEDQHLLKAQFQSTHTASTDQKGQHNCSLYLRMLNLNVIDCLKSVYSVIHLVGNIQRFSLLERSRRPDNLNEKWLIALCRLHVPRCILEISLVDYHKLEWISQHEMNGVMFYIDSRASVLSGFMPSEQLGLTPYSFLHEDDLEAVATSHGKIMKEDLVPETIFRLKTASGKYLYIKSSSCVARDPWTKQAKFIVSLNQLLDEPEGQKKLAIQRQELDSQKPSKMFTDDILTIMSDALTGNVTPLQDEVQCENRDWGCTQFMTPMGTVMRLPVSQQPLQTESSPPATSDCKSVSTNSTPVSSRKRPADDPFVKLIQASIMSDEEMDVSPSKCLQLSQACTKTTSVCNPCSASCTLSSEDNPSFRSECKACCSSNKPSGSMLKSLLTDEHVKHPACVGMSSNVTSPRSCPSSPRTSGSRSSPESQRTEKENSQESVATPMSVKSSTSDQNTASPGSSDSLQSSFVVTFTEQLKQKHALMEQSLLLQEATIFTLESEVKKVKSTGHSSPYLQKICDRIHAIKTSKAKQQAELQCLQNKLNQQKSSSQASCTQVQPGHSQQMTADVPSTLAQMVFPGSESTQRSAQIDLGEIEPTFYPTVMSNERSKTSPIFSFPKSVCQSSNQSFSHSSTSSVHSLSHTNTQSAHDNVVLASHVSVPQSPYSSFSQASLDNGLFSPGATSSASRGHVSQHNNINQTVSHNSGIHGRFSLSSNHASQQHFSSFPSTSLGYNQSVFGAGGQHDMVLGSKQMSGATPASSTQSYYAHQMPLTTPTVNNMAHSSISSRIIDGDRVKSRNERIKIITSAYSKLPQPACHPSSCATVPNVPPQNGLFTM